MGTISPVQPEETVCALIVAAEAETFLNAHLEHRVKLEHLRTLGHALDELHGKISGPWTLHSEALIQMMALDTHDPERVRAFAREIGVGGPFDTKEELIAWIRSQAETAEPRGE